MRVRLTQAIARQENALQAMEKTHGECTRLCCSLSSGGSQLTSVVAAVLVHLNVSADLAQLALLYSMRGDYDKALPLLHKRLVIHEKFGPGAWSQWSVSLALWSLKIDACT